MSDIELIDAVFISDLHLNSLEPDICDRFGRFVQWAAVHARQVYILGDFFHVWAGDDSQDSWSNAIADQISNLVKKGVQVFYMHGNRDFLLGNQFASRASMKIISDPTVIVLHGQRILLTHGDRYCTNDRGHQWLRRITRNRLFSTLFLRLPYRFRSKLVSQVRQRSQNNKHKTSDVMAIVFSVMLAHMRQMKVKIVIHGHIHQPGLIHHSIWDTNFEQYILSDWDDNPQILCYYKTKGFYFISI